MRTLVDIGEPEVRALDAMASRMGASRAALIRTAIGEWLARHRTSETDKAFGLWRSRRGDGLAYEDEVRAEW